MQSRGALELQQQVESLLGALVKAAAVELTKLFERTYLAAASPADTGRGDDQSGSLKTLNVADNKRSVGVQVDVVDCGSSELSGTCFCRTMHDFLFKCTVKLQANSICASCRLLFCMLLYI